MKISPNFIQVTGGGSRVQAESLLKRKINNGLRSEIGGRTITDIVSGQRTEVMEDTLRQMARSSELGIKVVDVKINRSIFRWKYLTLSISVCAPNVRSST